MNTQLVESIIQVVNALSPEERSLLKKRLLHDDRAQTVDLSAFSGSIQSLLSPSAQVEAYTQ